jgi:hypothetical protein
MSTRGRIEWCRSLGLHPALGRYRPDGDIIRRGPANPPFASVHCGVGRYQGLLRHRSGPQPVTCSLWRRPGCAKPSSCYAFLAAYRLTGQRVWLERARMAVRRAWRFGARTLGHDSLYKGALGVAVLASTLDRPESASMPLFEPLRFNPRLRQ